MAKPPKAFDVWFVAADTVYKGVPYSVVADWAQQGRLAPGDKVRPAGTAAAWVKVSDHEFLSDYTPRQTAAKSVPVPAAAFEEVASASEAEVVATAVAGEPSRGEPAELPEPEPLPRKSRADDDDDVDMIPLIDVSMVLLVFFILMRASGALAPVDVPEMRYGGQLSADPHAITITIEKKDKDNVIYSVRVGQQPAKPEHAKLETRVAVVDAVTALAAAAKDPPEVRIACIKELPRERVYELRRELQPLQDAKPRKINNFAATVIEAPKK